MRQRRLRCVQRRVLTDLCTELAQALVRDGEGVTRFVTMYSARRSQ
jgi:N-acetylglutamate synthase/N-acetylornithine aminotransferase